MVSSNSLPPLVGRVPANSDARLRVNRDGDLLEMIINIGELPSNDDVQARFVEQRLGTASGPFGLTVVPLDDANRDRLEVDTGGVLVKDVVEGSPAYQAGISPGDALLTIGNKTVDSAEELSQAANELTGEDSVSALLVRESGRAFVLMKPQ